VLAQTITDPIEIILVDDASVDRSADIARAEVAAAGRPEVTLRVIRSEANLGNGGAFVTALEAAQGAFYHVLDGDDFWIDPDKLRRQLALLQADPALAGAGHRTIQRSAEDGSESFHPRQEPLAPVLQLEDFLTGGTYFHTSSLLFRNIFRDPASGRVTVPPIFGEVRGDMVRLLVHAARGGIAYLPQTMSVYDDHGGGIWTGLDWPGRRALLRNLYTRLAEHGYLSALGEPAAAAWLAERLAEIAAYAPATLRPISLHPDQVADAARHRVTEVSCVTGILDLEAQLSALTAEREYEEALRLAHRFLTAIGYDRNIARAGRMRRLSSPEIDWHCAHVGGLIAAERGILPAPADPRAADEGPVVLVVSGMAPDSEGMWDATREQIALWRGRRRIVVLSTEFLATVPDIESRVGPGVELLLNTDATLVEKTAWLIWHIGRLRPARILLNPARNDVTIAAGVRREHAPRIHRIAVHQTGYLPAVHAYALDGHVVRRPYDLAWFGQVDPGRELIHLPCLIPAAAPPEPLAPSAPGGLPLVTATAAFADSAFEGHYDYGLHRIVPILLRSGAHRHIHAGALSEAMLNRIRKEMIRQEMPPAAFVHLPDAGDPGAALRAAGATLFLQGFPRPEAGPLLSAMAAGLPVLAHRSYLHPALSLADLCPPHTPEWRDGETLEALVRGIGPGWLAARSAEVAAHVATRHSAEALHATLGDAGFMATVPAEAVARIVPGAAVPDDRQSLRRLMSELFEMTIFRI
jgi:hypothetical protein